MILGFSTQLNGKPTYFVEKILCSLFDHMLISKADWEFYTKDLGSMKPHNEKYHTIREDKTDRWKPGTKIDFFINCRQKNMFRFAPVLPVVSVQKFSIFWTTKYMAMVHADDRYIGNAIWDKAFLWMICDLKVRQLAKNDGFETVEDFFRYFDKDFKGKLIHWTDLKY